MASLSLKVHIQCFPKNYDNTVHGPGIEMDREGVGCVFFFIPRNSSNAPMHPQYKTAGFVYKSFDDIYWTRVLYNEMV